MEPYDIMRNVDKEIDNSMYWSTIDIPEDCKPIVNSYVSSVNELYANLTDYESAAEGMSLLGAISSPIIGGFVGAFMGYLLNGPELSVLMGAAGAPLGMVVEMRRHPIGCSIIVRSYKSEMLKLEKKRDELRSETLSHLEECLK